MWRQLLWDRLWEAVMESAAMNELKRALEGLLKGNMFCMHLNLDLCHAREEGKKDQGCSISRLRDTRKAIPIAPDCNSWGKTSWHFLYWDTNYVPQIIAAWDQLLSLKIKTAKNHTSSSKPWALTAWDWSRMQSLLRLLCSLFSKKRFLPNQGIGLTIFAVFSMIPQR